MLHCLGLGQHGDLPPTHPPVFRLLKLTGLEVKSHTSVLAVSSFREQQATSRDTLQTMQFVASSVFQNFLLPGSAIQGCSPTLPKGRVGAVLHGRSDADPALLHLGTLGFT